MAKNVIALSYVGMTPPMTNRKIVKRKSYIRITMLDMIFFVVGDIREQVNLEGTWSYNHFGGFSAPNKWGKETVTSQ